MLVSVTRLHVRSRLYLVPFLIYTLRSGLQVRRARGFRGGTIGNDAEGGNWTITQWDNDVDMHAFRNSGAHREAMQKLLHWCDEASYAHYTTLDAALPAPDAAHERLTTGKISKVNHPSPLQAAGHTVSDGMPNFQLTLRPK